MIDVGQSVENDHPKYKHFIKRDISNFTNQYQSILEDLEDYEHLNIMFYFMIINNDFDNLTELFLLKNINQNIELIFDSMIGKLNEFDVDSEMIKM